MKKFLIALFSIVFLVLGTQVAYAWWTADTQITLTRTKVQAAVRNNLRVPIYCRGNAYGQTVSGHYLNSWNEGIIYPGHYGYTYVYTSSNNPFVRGWADIRCETRR